MTSSSEPFKTLTLKPREDRRLRHGHLWVFSNEVASDLGALAPGDPVDILDARGHFLGRGYANPHSLITARILTRRREPLDASFFIRRLEAARAYRRKLGCREDPGRLVHGEGDLLPGLVVDRYGDHLVIQTLTAGMERLLPEVVEALTAVYRPAAILARNDTPVRTLEGLPLEQKVLLGEPRERIAIREGDLTFEVDPRRGQKTGFFLDQQDNRVALREYFRDARVLDVFCYTGAWGLHAAAGGAREVLGLDASESAVQQAQRHAVLNGLADRCRFRVADAFEALRELEAAGETFQGVILDPPAFVKSRRHLADGLRGYREINLRALRLLPPGGILVSCSCSHHVSREAFLQVLGKAARDARRRCRLVTFRSQARDHPVLLGMRETEYLKCAVLVVV